MLKRTITLVAILLALIGIAGAEEVGAPGMGIDMPYTLILAPGASTNVVLEGNLASGDKVILTNGLGIFAEMIVP